MYFCLLLILAGYFGCSQGSDSESSIRAMIDDSTRLFLSKVKSMQALNRPLSPSDLAIVRDVLRLVESAPTLNLPHRMIPVDCSSASASNRSRASSVSSIAHFSSASNSDSDSDASFGANGGNYRFVPYRRRRVQSF